MESPADHYKIIDNQPLANQELGSSTPQRQTATQHVKKLPNFSRIDTLPIAIEIDESELIKADNDKSYMEALFNELVQLSRHSTTEYNAPGHICPLPIDFKQNYSNINPLRDLINQSKAKKVYAIGIDTI